MMTLRPMPRLVPSLAAASLFVAAAALATPAFAGCPPTPWPQEICSQFGRTSLAIDAYGHVDWRASHGPAAGPEDFGDASSVYQLCIWDEDHLVVAADIPADAECPGGSCWSADDSSGLGYRDQSGENSDIHLLQFTGSDSALTKLRAQTLVIGGINLPVGGGVIVQLVRNGGDACFESFLPADSFTLDDRAAFAARFDVDAAE